ARHENVAKQRNRPFAFSDLPACFLIQSCGGGDLVEIGRWPHEPRVPQARGSANRWLRPGTKPDRRSWPLHGAGRDGGIVHLVMLSTMSDILLSPEPMKQRSALLQSAAALLERITKRGEFLRSVAGAYAQNQPTAGNH